MTIGQSSTTARSAIWTSPGRRCGKPCIRGTRIDVMTVVHCLELWSIDRICLEFPGLKRAQVWAAIRYYVRNEKRMRKQRVSR